MSIRPTLSVPIFDGEVTVHAFGREHGVNFSFKGIDEGQKPFETHMPVFEALASIPSVCDYFAPSPAKMNAEVVESSQVTSRMYEHTRTAMAEDCFVLFRGADADGLYDLNRFRGYVMSAADCALIVAKNGDFIVAAHAGRNSIIDMQAMKGCSPRKNESVVHSIRERIEEAGLRFPETKVWVGFSLSAGPHFPHAFEDERNPHNSRMVEYVARHYGLSCFKQDGQGGTLGWLDTKELISRQFLSLGVPNRQIELDSVCTYSDVDDHSKHIWYSNVRNAEEGVGGRNLIAVVVNP
jgi:copper oxidase (laccase) domain-containing protein